MREIGGSTHVTFPSGAVSGRSRVLLSEPLDGGYGVVTRETPFHPLDPWWPDQPADVGLLRADGLELRVVDCVTGALSLVSGDLLLGPDIWARRGDDAWAWLVVHVVERPVPEGGDARLMVDVGRRRALSAGHTACHLMALALNAALESRWRREADRLDGLGRPDFDRLAVTSSRIVAHGSRDVYRIGRSLRSKGFVADALAASLPDIAAMMDGLLADWLATGAPVRVGAPSPGLGAARTWRCELPEAAVEIPCGGTHLAGLDELGTVGVSLELSPECDELVVETRATEARPVRRSGRGGDAPGERP